MTDRPLPLPRRILLVFGAPVRLFRSERPLPWEDALLAATGITIFAAVLLVPDAVYLEQARLAAERSGVELTSPPGEIARAERVMAGLGSAVVEPLLAVALAGILMLSIPLFTRGRITFARCLAVSSHALLVRAIGTVLVLTTARLTAADPGAGPLALVPGSAVLVPNALAGLDPFTLWAVAVAGAGAAVSVGRRAVAGAALAGLAYLGLLVVPFLLLGA